MTSLLSSHTTRREKGFSLIEIMVALVIGLFISAAVVNIFIASKQSFRLQEATAQIQEDGRFALDIMKHTLRMAGYTGCYGELSSVGENVLQSPTSFAWDTSNSIQGFDNVAANDTIGGITDFIAGTDLLVLKGMSDGVPLSVSSDGTEFKIDVGNNRFEAGDVLLVTSCDDASIFQATGVATASGVTTISHSAGGSMVPGNQTGTLTTLFTTDAEIARLETFVYYISTGANGRPALFEARLSVSGGTTVSLQSNELASNFDDMQIVYGVDTDSDRDVDVYQDAGSVTDWGNVVSARLSLMVASNNDNLVSAPGSYSFDSDVFTYDKDDTPSSDADRRLRRSFNGFVALRNRIL
ncbi:MAG: prepilin-type N-terminal cleavage/methylation domain-containing protein [Gammaproteobacteria bacterium]|nr:prepilin-type N-terminal cleavage/methylation domain-containing protein [Gammaproteobacteria bacterium]